MHRCKRTTCRFTYGLYFLLVFGYNWLYLVEMQTPASAKQSCSFDNYWDVIRVYLSLDARRDRWLPARGGGPSVGGTHGLPCHPVRGTAITSGMPLKPSTMAPGPMLVARAIFTPRFVPASSTSTPGDGAAVVSSRPTAGRSACASPLHGAWDIKLDSPAGAGWAGAGRSSIPHACKDGTSTWRSPVGSTASMAAMACPWKGYPFRLGPASRGGGAVPSANESFTRGSRRPATGRCAGSRCRATSCRRARFRGNALQ